MGWSLVAETCPCERGPDGQVCAVERSRAAARDADEQLFAGIRAQLSIAGGEGQSQGVDGLAHDGRDHFASWGMLCGRR